MEKKIRIVFEILFVIVAVFYYYKKVFIPEYRAKNGSSDFFIKTDSYSNMVEVSIDNHIDFAFIWNNEKLVYHMFFLSKDSSCLYNKNIEGKNFEEAITLSFQLLDRYHYLDEKSSIKLIRYGDKNYSNFLELFTTNLHQYGIFNIIEEENTLEKKSRELGLDASSKKIILFALDLYSKEKVKS